MTGWRLLAFLLIVACSKRSTEPAVAPAVTRSESAPPIDAATVGTVAAGQPCSSDGECVPGLACVHYSTIGGERKASCERRCGPAPDYVCPAGDSCFIGGDGPSEVCIKSGKLR